MRQGAHLRARRWPLTPEPCGWSPACPSGSRSWPGAALPSCSACGQCPACGGGKPWRAGGLWRGKRSGAAGECDGSAGSGAREASSASVSGDGARACVCAQARPVRRPGDPAAHAGEQAHRWRKGPGHSALALPVHSTPPRQLECTVATMPPPPVRPAPSPPPPLAPCSRRRTRGSSLLSSSRR